MKKNFHHCSECGSPYSSLVWPRRCNKCGDVFFQSVGSVAVLLIPVEPRNLIVIRRDVEPKRGEFALPGGYVDATGETWQQACVREAYEESSGTININASFVREWMVRSTDTNLTLIFGIAPRATPEWFRGVAKAFRPNSEVTEIGLIDQPEDLAFPHHTEAALRWFNTFTVNPMEGYLQTKP
jgi:8-oxo-dGTP diphosphatase